MVIAIEYRIAAVDTYAFLEVMAERRQIRRRNGAELWFERYHTPTRTEYLRHNLRLTHDDAMIIDRVKALHRGPGEPLVRRLLERPTGYPPESRELDSTEWVPPMTDQSRLS